MADFEPVNYDRRSLYLFGGIDTDSIAPLVKALWEMGASNRKKQITLFINSDGGSVDEAFALYDSIKLCGAPVAGLVNGVCQSAATLVLQACKHRFMTQNSTLMLHAGSIGIGRDHVNEAKSWMDESLKTMARFDSLLAARTTYSSQELSELTRFAKFFSASEAVSVGLADKVLTAPLPLRAPRA